MSSLQDAGKEVARISCCTHEFCTPCILQWSQTENSCPLCKQRFTQITTQHPDTPRSSQRKRRSRAPRRITVPHRTQRSEAGRVLDSILQSLHGGGVAVGTGTATGIGIGFAVGGTPPTQVMPWIVRGDASVELEQFLRRFFVSTTGEPRLVFGHSAETAIEIHEDEAVVELE
jgi:Ring finger domain